MDLHPTYPLRTERLLLRPVTAADAADMAAYWSRADVCRYLPIGPLDRDAILSRLADGWAPSAIEAGGGRMVLGVEVAATGAFVGDVMLALRSEEHRSGEVGWVLNPDHRGRGYATEAAGVMLRLGFEDLGLHRIVARIEARNDASCRVSERLGMRREAHLVENEWFRGEWSDEIVYALLDREWPATTAANAHGGTR